jgi:hypothetical protein
MVMKDIPKAVLPSPYAKWADELLGPIPAETESTCQDCPLLLTKPDNKNTDSIHPRTKCCTYYPDLMNFQIGNILNENNPHNVPARDIVTSRVRAQFGATPLKLQRPPVYNVIYEKNPFMGSAMRLRCPYYIEELLNGACGIWQFRNAVCITWFCKYVRGSVGKSFWRDALEPLFKSLEDSLGFWCLTRLNLPEVNLERLLKAPNQTHDSKFTPGMLDETTDPKTHQAIWGPYAGHEMEFYQECGRLVSSLSTSEVLAIGGPKATLYLSVARKAYNALISTCLPHTVRPGRFLLQPQENGVVQVAGYSGCDPLTMPADVLTLLYYFEGRTVQEALNAIREETRFEMEPDLVRKLLDFEILMDSQETN